MADGGRMTRPLASALVPLLLAGCDPATPAGPAPDPVATEAPATARAVVIVSVTGVEPGGEPVEAALQTQAEWGTDGAALRARVPAGATAVALRFDGVTPGRYAVTAVQPAVPVGVGPRGARTGPAGAVAAPAQAAAQAQAPVQAVVSGPTPLSPRSAGGWTATGASGRDRPDWDAAATAVGAEGATVPLTLGRR